MKEIIDLLLKRFFPFTIVGNNSNEGVELFFRIKDNGQNTLYSIKEYYSPIEPPQFDFYDFVSDPNIEILNLTLSEILEKIEEIPIDLIYKIE